MAAVPDFPQAASTGLPTAAVRSRPRLSEAASACRRTPPRSGMELLRKLTVRVRRRDYQTAIQDIRFSGVFGLLYSTFWTPLSGCGFRSAE